MMETKKAAKREIERDVDGLLKHEKNIIKKYEPTTAGVCN